jgi:hypothetical protein
VQITPRQAAQRLLDALAAALPHAPHCGEFDRVADAADDLRKALEREEEALTARGNRNPGAAGL